MLISFLRFSYLHSEENRSVSTSTPQDGQRWWDLNVCTSPWESPALQLLLYHCVELLLPFPLSLPVSLSLSLSLSLSSPLLSLPSLSPLSPLSLYITPSVCLLGCLCVYLSISISIYPSVCLTHNHFCKVKLYRTFPADVFCLIICNSETHKKKCS